MAEDNLSSADIFAAALADPPTEPSASEPGPAPAQAPVPKEPVPKEPAQAPAPKEPATPTPPPAGTVEPPKEAQESIPSWRLREEAEARRAAEDRSRKAEAQLAHIESLVRQQEAQQAAREPAKAPDFYADPEAAVQSMISQALEQTLTPFVLESRKERMALAKSFAMREHTPEVVNAAEKAFMEANDAGTIDPYEYERVIASPNRWDACVDWHKRQQTLSTVGRDPNAWFEQQFEARMADPAFAAKVMEKVRGAAATRPGSVQLPPSLSRSGSAGPALDGPQGDLSDADLFKYARSA